jgi:hypothetical protein
MERIAHESQNRCRNQPKLRAPSLGIDECQDNARVGNKIESNARANPEFSVREVKS